MHTILLAFATREGQTEKVARRIAASLEQRGESVTVSSTDDRCQAIRPLLRRSARADPAEVKRAEANRPSRTAAVVKRAMGPNQGDAGRATTVSTTYSDDYKRRVRAAR